MGNKFSHLESKSNSIYETQISFFLGKIIIVISQYWIWCPIMSPILGALFGAFVYDAFLYTGEENIVARSFVIFFISLVQLVYLPVFTDVRLIADLRLTTRLCSGYLVVICYFISYIAQRL